MYNAKTHKIYKTAAINNYNKVGVMAIMTLKPSW